MDFDMKELEMREAPALDNGQTNNGCYSDNKLTDEGDIKTPRKNQKPPKYILSKGDILTVKMAKGLVVYNLIGFVFLLLGCTVIYLSLTSHFQDELLTSLELFVFSDILLVAEKIVFMAALVNKKKLIKLCLLLNITAIQLKIVAAGLSFHLIPSALVVSLILFVLQGPHNLVIYLIYRRWKQIPQRKWKKQLILVRKPIPQVIQ